MAGPTTEPAAPRQRLDKWLWHARVARTRATAAELAASGYVRINGRRAQQAAKPVSMGDIVTIALPHRVRVLEVLGLSQRRGSFSDASKLYREIDSDGATLDRQSDPASD
ncbi:RNA-binding S4 domain-containing protein [Rhodoblastus sp.]|uniref:RNA-binding S4 domain-containing protein n=1 Tax=Rhodoblastus sp. TaxID=1962975 RepID=UPI00262DA2D6|nr:RNA-binding S4 domain-containing protein [Rhodoblastus sp.]